MPCSKKMEEGLKTERKRLEWLDAMRGFTMIMVVAFHVSQISYVETLKTSAALPFLVLFRMPLFFFVSGFLAYKSRFVWTARNTLGLLGKKLKIQVFPALVFLCVFIVLRKSHFWPAFTSSMASPTKSGYWFTWVLLQMFLVYYLTCFAIRRLPEKVQHGCLWGLWLLTLVAYEFCYMPKVFDAENCEFLKASSLLQTMKFMHFFVMGNLVHRYWDAPALPEGGTDGRGPWQRVLDSAWFFPLICILAFVCCADVFRWHNLKFVWTNLPRTIAMYCLLFIVVTFFRHYKQWFTQQTAVGRGLQYVGTRTLDVYLLHFILMPKLPEVGQWMNQHQPNFLIDILISVLPALVIVAFCLLISNILRISPLFSENFFGRKG